MLVLSGRIQERIVIGEDIGITLLRVRLGLECDRSVPIR